jgi:uncharacterized protein YoxC
MNENNLDMIFSISGIVFFVFFTIVGIILILSLRKFVNTIQNIEKEAAQFSKNLAPVLLNFQFISEDLKSISVRSRSQFSKVEDLSENLIDKGSKLINTIDQIQNAGNYIIMNSTNFVNAVRKGFSSFTDKFKTRSALLQGNADQFN